MAGDPSENVNCARNGDLNKTKFYHNKEYVVNICSDDDRDESTPFQPPDQDTVSLLSITRAIRQLAVAAGCLVLSMFLNLTILSVIHERVPRDSPPLPDVLFSVIFFIINLSPILKYYLLVVAQV